MRFETEPLWLESGKGFYMQDSLGLDLYRLSVCLCTHVLSNFKRWLFCQSFHFQESTISCPWRICTAGYSHVDRNLYDIDFLDLES
jgi:hypothetical protein